MISPLILSLSSSLPSQPSYFIPQSALSDQESKSGVSCLIGANCDLFKQAWEIYPELQRGFTSLEQEYCLSRARSFESLAGRWATKHAASHLGHGIWTDFEILRSEAGVPSLKAFHPDDLHSRWEMSITHDHPWAYALVFLR